MPADKATMTTLLENVEAQLHDEPPPFPRQDASVERFVPTKYRHPNSDSFELIQQDLRKLISECERQLEAIRKRLDENVAGVKNAIDDMKRLAG